MRASWSSLKSNSSPFLDESMVIWSNLAFIPDDEYDHSSEGSYSSSSSRSNAKCATDFNRSYSFSRKNVPLEEVIKLKEEFEKETEKELEKEIMEGILVLVRKLSNLKAKQITRSLKNFNLEEFLRVLYGSSFCDAATSCKLDEHWSPDWINSQSSTEKSESMFSDGYFEGEAALDTDIESIIERWTCHSD